MLTLSLLFTSTLFGGMVLYAFGFAAFLFSALPADIAGQTIRRAFPHFYMFVILSGAAAAIPILNYDQVNAGVLGFISVTSVPTRQILMPAINRATDTGEKILFKRLHGISVSITIFHILLTGFALSRFLTYTAM